MKQNESLNNTCILFDPNNEAQQKAIIRFYNDNGYTDDFFLEKWSRDIYIGICQGDLGYWNNNENIMKVIDLPKEYYPIDTPIEQSTFLLTENNGETKPYVVVDKNGDKGYVTPIVESENVEKTDFLESIEFFDLMQQYRIANPLNQELVINSFKSVKDYIKTQIILIYESRNKRRKQTSRSKVPLFDD